ncbi:MAG: hypothetical protein ACLPVY_22920 [Acidimicrobiia bacterium]
MRKLAGVLLAAAMMLPVGVMVSPAGAATGTTCKTASGTATFTPPLPKIGSTTKVKPTIKVTGTLGGCTGGGVTGGTISATLKQAVAGNCSSLLAGATANIAGTETITWNTKATSTVALKLTGVTKKATETTATGPVSAGLFKGTKQAGTLNYTPLSHGCTTAALVKVSFKQITALTI